MPSIPLPEPSLREILTAVQRLDEGQTEILEAIQVFSTDVDERFDTLETRVGGIESNVSAIKTEITGVKGEITGLKDQMSGMKDQISSLKKETVGIKGKINDIESRLISMEGTMVTKEYLDSKLFTLCDDLTQIAKRMGKQLEQLIEELVNEKSLKQVTADRLLAIGT
ncbi:hypothetical protein KBD61_02660 [Patescibacteria group bacterium]|nr:hypothetical protein [Patescibacteria group bacterium]MBP9709906.1 hypothetical protein [Patescibacteria group bacterium]